MMNEDTKVEGSHGCPTTCMKKTTGPIRRFFLYMGDICDAFFYLNLLVITGWACVWAWLSVIMNQMADEDPTGKVAQWTAWLEGCFRVVNVIGTLFVFTLAFRFNQCYARWWDGRQAWSSMMQTAIHINLMNRSAITDKGYADRLSRYTVAFPYVCKALLRGKSVTDPGESGDDLLQRGLLSQEELDDFRAFPCWEPYYIIDLMNSVVAKAYHPSHKGAYAYEKEHMKALLAYMFKLSEDLGNVMCIRSAGMPTSYDTIHFVFFYVYFLLAPPAWSMTTGWALPVYIAFTAGIIMALILLGTKLVDPFGGDVVDLPLDNFCEAVEIQIHEIDARRKRMQMRDFIAESTTIHGSSDTKGILLPERLKSSLHLLQEQKADRKELLSREASRAAFLQSRRLSV